MKLRHYWNNLKGFCDCGCCQRIWVCGKWVCLARLKEEVVKAKLFDTFVEMEV